MRYSDSDGLSLRNEGGEVCGKSICRNERHRDDFLRGYRPAMLFSGSIVTPSLEAAVLNAQYVNSNPLDRIAWDSQANGLISPADI